MTYEIVHALAPLSQQEMATIAKEYGSKDHADAYYQAASLALERAAQSEGNAQIKNARCGVAIHKESGHVLLGVEAEINGRMFDWSLRIGP